MYTKFAQNQNNTHVFTRMLNRKPQVFFHRFLCHHIPEMLIQRYTLIIVTSVISVRGLKIETNMTRFIGVASVKIVKSETSVKGYE